jgi:hypothetical protein
MRSIVLILSLLALLVVPILSQSAPPLIPPGHAKLPAPENVVCPVVGTDAVVSWDLVLDAAAYQVEFMGILADGTPMDDSDFVVAPPDVIGLNGFTTLTVHVRALPGPKHAGGPFQGGGPKGEWSPACSVTMPVLP